MIFNIYREQQQSLLFPLSNPLDSAFSNTFSSIFSVQKTITCVRLQTDSKLRNTQTKHQSESANIAGANDMLKKSPPIPTQPLVSSGRSLPGRLGSGRPASPMRLVTSGGVASKLNKTHTATEDNNALGSIESWRLLLKQLSRLVGNEGSAAIFFHSIGQLGVQYPALQTLSPQHSWPEQLATVQNTLLQLPHSAAAFARQSLWFRGCQLLTKLFGLSLSRRLLHQVAAVQSSYQHG